MLAPLALSFHYQLLVAVLAAVLMWFGQIFSHHLIACATLTQHQASQRPYGASKRTAERYQFLSWQLQLVQVQVPSVFRLFQLVTLQLQQV